MPAVLTASRKLSVTFQIPFPMITDAAAVYDVPTKPLLNYLEKGRHEPFYREVVRISGDPLSTGTFKDTGGSFTWSKDSIHHYTRDNPWSRDGKYLHLENRGTSGGIVYGGSPSHLILDGLTYEVLRGYPAGFVQGDHKWMPSLLYPHAMLNIPPSPNNTRIEIYDVIAGVQLMTMNLPVASGIGPDKGTTSRDGRYVVLTNSNSGSTVTQFYVVDLIAQTYGPLTTCKPVPGGGAGQPTVSGFSSTIGNVSLSPLGNYVIVSYSGDYQQVWSVNKATLTCTLMNYATVIPASGGKSVNGTNGTPANGWIYPTSHLDVGLDAFGNEIVVGTEAAGMHGILDSNHTTFDATGNTAQMMGTVVAVKLSDGTYLSLIDPGASETNPTDSPSHHTSLQNFDRPGWATVSFYINKGLRFQGEIINVATDGSKAVERLCHAHSATSGCFRCEEHPTPHYNGRRVIFTSNWLRKAVNPNGSQLIRQSYVVNAPLSP